ncbi:uncharacterized protein LOC126840171 [Adelges cooleyi]|uniref:uncharacterized protein LOC126840171 n=1 Tax=Adelges cooleyi TaxID=133065 RepID=UPI00217F7EC3|nr:uncharacterized protein LOC126840171 [Adelges cooleyi]
MLNSLRDGQVSYENTSCPSAHVPPHNVVAPIQNTHVSTEPSAPLVHPWNSNHRLEQLYGFHPRYYNLDFPTPYPPANNQYAPANMYGQSVSSQCCQPCCRIRTQNIPKASPPQALYGPSRPAAQQVNRPHKPKKQLKSSSTEQFLPYIPNDLPGKYSTQNSYPDKYSNSYISNSSYGPPPPTHSNNNLWIPPTANANWSDRLRSTNPYGGVVPHEVGREKNYPRLPTNYQNIPYSNPTSVSTHHKPYNYMLPPPPPIHEVLDYRPPVYHNVFKSNLPEYKSHTNNARMPIPSQTNQIPSSMQQYYNTQPVSYPNTRKPNEIYKTETAAPANSSKSKLNVREFLATWDEGEEETSEKPSEPSAPIVVLDCMTLEGDALAKVQEKLNVVTYESLEKVLKENPNSLILNTELDKVDTVSKTSKPSKSNFEPIDYTKRETGIIKPFNTEKKQEPELMKQSEKNYQNNNFDDIAGWYGKKNSDISSTDLIERLADRMFNLSKTQGNEMALYGAPHYTNQITQPNRTVENNVRCSTKYNENQQMFSYHQRPEKLNDSHAVSKNSYVDNPNSRTKPSILMDNNSKHSAIKYNNVNSCIVENENKKWPNLNNKSQESSNWEMGQSTQEQHLNMSLYDHSVIIKPLDFSSLTDETKGNPFSFEKNTSIGDKPNNLPNTTQFNKQPSNNNNYSPSAAIVQQTSGHHSESSNRNFPVIVSPHITRQEYNGYHESVIQRTGCDKNRNEKAEVHTDFENMNWNLTNDLDKIMKTNNPAEETSSCLYDKTTYSNMLNSINSNKDGAPAQWKTNAPCVDPSVSNKTNHSHDPFFDSWNFIESYGSTSGSDKKIDHRNVNNETTSNSLFTKQISPLPVITLENKNDINSGHENKMLLLPKESSSSSSYSDSNQMTSNSECSRDVFNLNNRIPDFNDSFELLVANHPPDYTQPKKPSEDSEHRTDGSIFEHLTESKTSMPATDPTKLKHDQSHKCDLIGLPSFKEKDPLAPMPMPPKLNVVKPILRDPSQMYTVIKQKMKNYNPCVDNNDIGRMDNCIRTNSSSNHVEHSDLKSKFKNNMQINHYDMWSEKYAFKDHPVHSTMPTVQCDVQAAQFRNAHQETHNRSGPTVVMTSQQQIKDTALQESLSSTDLTANKMMEGEKIDSADFLDCCLDNSKVNDQKYRDTLDEFETSFEFDIHCHTRTSDSFHERIVDKCLEERVKDQIGENDVSVPSSTDDGSMNMTSTSNDIAHASYDCDFQSGYLLKKILDENKNKTEIGSQITSNNKTVDTNDFRCPAEVRSTLPDFRSDKVNHQIENLDDYPHTILKSDTRCMIENLNNFNKNNKHFNFSDTTPKSSLEINYSDNNNESRSVKKPMPLDCLNEINSNYKLDSYAKSNYASTDSLQTGEVHDLTEEIDLTMDLAPINSTTNEMKIGNKKLDNEIKDNECNTVLRNDIPNILKTNINVVSIESKNEVIEIHEFVRCNNKSVSQNIYSVNVASPCTNHASLYEDHVDDRASSKCDSEEVQIVKTQTETTVSENILVEHSVSNDEPLMHVKTNSPEISNVGEQERSDDSDNWEPISPPEALHSPLKSPVVRSPGRTDEEDMAELNGDVTAVFNVDSTQKPLALTSTNSVCEDAFDTSETESKESAESSDDVHLFDEQEAELEGKRVLEMIYKHLESLDEEENELILTEENMEIDNNSMPNDNDFGTISEGCSEPINTRAVSTHQLIVTLPSTTTSVLPQSNPKELTDEVSPLKENCVESTSPVTKQDEIEVFNEKTVEPNNGVLSDTGQKNIDLISQNYLQKHENPITNIAVQSSRENVQSCVGYNDNGREPVAKIVGDGKVDKTDGPKKPEDTFKTTRGHDSYRLNKVETPRIKFMLKCKNMIRKNVFHSESTPVSAEKQEKSMSASECGSAQTFLKGNDDRRDNTVGDIQTASPRLHFTVDHLNDNGDPSVRKEVDGRGGGDDTENISENTSYGNDTTAANTTPLFETIIPKPDREEEPNVVLDIDNVVGIVVSDEDSNSFDCCYTTTTPVPSPVDDFPVDGDDEAENHEASTDFWDKSLENEYKSVLRRTISKLTRNPVRLRDKFNIRWVARRIGERRRRRLREKRKKWARGGGRSTKGGNKTPNKVVQSTDGADSEATTTCVVTGCKIKVQLPWGRIFNLDRSEDTKLELGPAKVEVRLSRTPGEWQVAACPSKSSSKSVVSVRRLILRRASASPKRQLSSDSDCSSSNSSSSSSNNNNNNGYSRQQLPKIVIRRNGDDSYTSHVSGSELDLDKGDDCDDDGGDDDSSDDAGTRRRQIPVVVLHRNSQLDKMATSGVTTLRLKRHVPISSTDSSDTDGGTAPKRARHTQ